MKKGSIVIAFALALISCGRGYETVPYDSPVQDASVAVGHAEFFVEGDSVSDIVIPDVAGLTGTAFVVSSNPAKVVAINIDERPMHKSNGFVGLNVPSGSGVPKRVEIIGPDLGLLLTSSSVIVFNPRLGRVVSTTSVVDGVRPGGASSLRIEPGVSTDIVHISSRVFVSSENMVVQAFELDEDGFLERGGHVVTSCPGTSTMAEVSSSRLVVVGAGRDSTNACVDVIDANSLETLHTIDMGQAMNPPRRITLAFDGSRGFFNFTNQTAQLDLLNNRLLEGFGSYSLDVVLSSDNATLFTLDAMRSSIIAVDLSVIPPRPLPAIALFGEGGILSGQVAVRPGTRGREFFGEDVFAAVNMSSGARLVAIDSGRDARRPYDPLNPEAPDEPSVGGGSPDVPETFITPPPLPPPPPTGSSRDSCQGFAQAVSSYRLGVGSGFGEIYMPNIVLGPPRGAGRFSGSMDVLSLGQHGEIILDLGNCHALNGPGADFIVFENAFLIGGDPLSPNKELATVGVSSDGLDFVDFTCSDAAYPYTGCAGWHAVFSNPRNTISPFAIDAAGGDAFDLADAGLSEVRYIRVRDRDGDGLGDRSGFDLDAVAVVNGVIE